MRRLVLLALVACQQPPKQPVVTPAPPPGVHLAYERILPNPARNRPPRFEGEILVVGSTCWRDGQRLDHCAKATDETGREVSPEATATLHIEDDNTLVVQWTNEAVRTTAVSRACWTDEHRVVWIDNHQWVELDLRGRATHRFGAIAGSIAACEPAGGRAVVADGSRTAVIDLATRSELAHLDVHADHVAIAADKLAIISDHALVVLRQFGRTYLPELRRTSDQTFKELAFSRDGSQLAVVGETLVAFAVGAAPQRAPDLPVAELPAGFTAMQIDEAWSYAQLASPSRWAPLPAQLVRARDEKEYREVVTLAIEPATVSPILSATDDAAIRSYAVRMMPELFVQWANAKIETGPDAAFALRVGRREGKPYFETRELWTDGCEPYDGYTQVVIERELLFVTRVLVPPGDTTDPWLQAFFDLPFKARTKLARRRGPELGPC